MTTVNFFLNFFLNLSFNLLQHSAVEDSGLGSARRLHAFQLIKFEILNMFIFLQITVMLIKACFRGIV